MFLKVSLLPLYSFHCLISLPVQIKKSRYGAQREQQRQKTNMGTDYESRSSQQHLSHWRQISPGQYHRQWVDYFTAEGLAYIVWCSSASLGSIHQMSIVLPLIITSKVLSDPLLRWDQRIYNTQGQQPFHVAENQSLAPAPSLLLNIPLTSNLLLLVTGRTRFRISQPVQEWAEN